MPTPDKVFVIFTPEYDRVTKFFEAMGLEFKREKHGKGPEHFACEHNGFVFEIYPSKANVRTRFIDEG